MKRSYLRRRLLASLAAVAMPAAGGMLSGCTPEYNWREVRYPEQGVIVMLPGKPASLTRRISLDGEPVDMTMHGTAAGGSNFAVGVVRLTDRSRRDKYLAAMRAQMVRNIAGRETSVITLPVRVLDREGNRRDTAPATVIRADGTIREAPARMIAGFVGHGDRVVQFVVMGPATDVDDDEAKVFVESLRLTE
ncbi:MAG TPA: hypothetical protein PKA20_16445 [Burkholderiaceae bacterium]|nr:hypothetical protein [Burkholderiaceae bacterium]